MTPNSATSSYLAASDFLARMDARTVGDLCSDSGVRISASALIGPPVNANLQAALDDAAGTVESACLKGQRYQPTDLSALIGVSQKYLWRLIATLAMAFLVQRRPDLNRPLPLALPWAMDQLEKLGQGERIFGMVEAQEAGLPQVYQELATDVQRRDLIDVQGRRFFGRRVDQSPNFPQ